MKFIVAGIGEIGAIDHRAFAWFMGLRCRQRLVKMARYVSCSGGGYLYVALPLLLVLLNVSNRILFLQCVCVGFGIE